MKVCGGCNSELPVSGFYTGHNKCKACVIARVKAHREANIDRIRAYDRQRYAESDERKANARECVKRSRADGRNRLYQKRHIEKHPQARAARVTLNNAVRDGKVTKGCCAVCGSSQVQAHHEDYSKPLEVVWLCSTHHGETWRGARAA